MKEKIPNRKHYRKSDKNTEQLKTDIQSLDLTCIREVVMKECRWRDQFALYVEQQYRNFLFLCGSTGDIIVPTGAIDIFWHHHILDTLKYADDCQKSLGFFLHHFPYLGKQGDANELTSHFVRTKQVYEATFGHPYDLNEAMDLDEDLNRRFDAEARSCG